MEVWPNGWKRGETVRVIKVLDLAVHQYRTTDRPPPIGATGEIVSINTVNNKVHSVGVQFSDRSWVLPVDHLTLGPAEDEVQAAITSIKEAL